MRSHHPWVPSVPEALYCPILCKWPAFPGPRHLVHTHLLHSLPPLWHIFLFSGAPWSQDRTSTHAILSVWKTFPILPYCLVFLRNSEVISSEKLTLTIWSKSSLTCVSQCPERVWKQELNPVPRVSNPVGLWWELRMYISNKILGYAEAGGPGTMLGEPLTQSTPSLYITGTLCFIVFFFFLNLWQSCMAEV